MQTNKLLELEQALKVLVPCGNIAVHSTVGRNFESVITFSYVIPNTTNLNESLVADPKIKHEATIGNFLHFLKVNPMAQNEVERVSSELLTSKRDLEEQLKAANKEIGKLECFKELYKELLNDT